MRLSGLATTVTSRVWPGVSVCGSVCAGVNVNSVSAVPGSAKNVVVSTETLRSPSFLIWYVFDGGDGSNRKLPNASGFGVTVKLAIWPTQSSEISIVLLVNESETISNVPLRVRRADGLHAMFQVVVPPGAMGATGPPVTV